jgi:hypothetical protein
MQKLSECQQTKQGYQVGFVDYDQWQVSANGGTIGQIQASSLPYYPAHAIGFQTNYISMKTGLNFFFKYHEIGAKAHTVGRTIVFVGRRMLRFRSRN